MSKVEELMSILKSNGALGHEDKLRAAIEQALAEAEGRGFTRGVKASRAAAQPQPEASELTDAEIDAIPFEFSFGLDDEVEQTEASLLCKLRDFARAVLAAAKGKP